MQICVATYLHTPKTNGHLHALLNPIGRFMGQATKQSLRLTRQCTGTYQEHRLQPAWLLTAWLLSLTVWLLAGY